LSRGSLAIVADGPRPDLVHLHRRVAAEIPELELHSLFTRSASEFLWETELPPEIRARSLARGHDPSDIHRWWGRPRHDWRKGGELIAHLRAHSARAVVLNGYSDLTCVRVLRWCNANGVPVLERGDANLRCEPPAGPLKAALKRPLLGAFLRRCDAVLPFGRFGLEFYTKYGADPARCHRVPAIPDFALFTDVPVESVAAFRRAHGLVPDRRRIFFCGRLIRFKRPDLLVDGFARIADARPDWDLLVAGSGPLEAETRARVPEHLAPRITWLGELPWRELPPAYHACDLLALPSEVENWGVVVLEAMAAGLPVVASDIAQAANECFEDGVAGRRFRSRDLDAFVEALMDATDPERLAGYRRAVPGALADWRERCDPVKGLRKALAAVGVLDG